MGRSYLMGIVLSLIVTSGTLTAQPANGISWESFEKIHKGMTEKEIERILGVPFGQYTTGKVNFLIPTATITIQVSTYRLPAEYLATKADGFSMARKAWIGNQLGIWVFFDEEDRVFTTRAYPVSPAIPDLFEWICNIPRPLLQRRHGTMDVMRP